MNRHLMESLCKQPIYKSLCVGGLRLLGLVPSRLCLCRGRGARMHHDATAGKDAFAPCLCLFLLGFGQQPIVHYERLHLRHVCREDVVLALGLGYERDTTPKLLNTSNHLVKTM